MRNNVALYLPEKLDDTSPTNLIYEISIFMRATPSTRTRPLAIHPPVLYIYPRTPARRANSSSSSTSLAPLVLLIVLSRAVSLVAGRNRLGVRKRQSGERILPSMINLNARARKSTLIHDRFSTLRKISGKRGSRSIPPPKIALTSATKRERQTEKELREIRLRIQDINKSAQCKY